MCHFYGMAEMMFSVRRVFQGLHQLVWIQMSEKEVPCNFRVKIDFSTESYVTFDAESENQCSQAEKFQETSFFGMRKCI